MNSKHPHPQRILLHGHGLGELTDDDIEKRACEIAAIKGRPGGEPEEEDRAEAHAELQGDSLPATTNDDAESVGALSRDPSDPPLRSGKQAPNLEGDNEEEAVERLATEGVEEAQHDQMLAASRRARRASRH